MSDKFKETYDKGTDLEKVSLNIDKCLKMIQNRDYYNAYNILDETFRNNNFGDRLFLNLYLLNNLYTYLQNY